MSNNPTESILSRSITYEKSFDETLRIITGLYNTITKFTPPQIRAKYNNLSNAVEEKVNEINKAKTDLNNAIISITNSIDKLNEFHKILEKIQQTLNIGRLGTLEGITRENIEKEKFHKEDLPEEVQEVLNQDYNEQEVLKQYYDKFKQLNVSGGFGKRSKSKKTKSKKSKTTKKHRFHKFIRK